MADDPSVVACAHCGTLIDVGDRAIDKPLCVTCEGEARAQNEERANLQGLSAVQKARI